MKLKQLLNTNKSVMKDEKIKGNKVTSTKVRKALRSTSRASNERTSSSVKLPETGGNLGWVGSEKIGSESRFMQNQRESRIGNAHLTRNAIVEPEPIDEGADTNSSLQEKKKEKGHSYSASLSLSLKNMHPSNRVTSPSKKGPDASPPKLGAVSEMHNKSFSQSHLSPFTSFSERSFGGVHVIGGPDGFEAGVVSARDLAIVSGRKGDHFVVVLWVDNDVGHTKVIEDSVDPVWSSDEMFPLKVPMSLAMSECVLEFQLWSMKPKEERRGDFNGAVRLTGEELVGFLTGSAPWASRIERPLSKTPSLPDEVQQEKNIQGHLTLLGGPSGLFEQEPDRYDLQILSGSGFGKRVFCIVTWNKKYLDRTTVGGAQGDPIWEDQKFHICESHGTDVSETCLLMVEVFEMGFFGPGEFVGCIILSKFELGKLLCETYATVKTFPLTKDPDRDENKQRKVRGSLILRGGAPDTRCIDESTVVIFACQKLAVLNEVNPHAYCLVFWNDVQIGKTSVVPDTPNPFWVDASIHIKTSNMSVSISSSKLEIQVWNNVGVPTFLGGTSLHGTELSRMLDSGHATDMVLVLESNEKFKAPGGVQGRIRIGTPGTSFPSQAMADKAREEKATVSTRILEQEMAEQAEE